MSRTACLSLCTAGTALIGAAYLSAFMPNGPRWGAWCMVGGLASLCAGCMALGAHRRGRRSALFYAALVFTALAIVLGFGLALVLPPTEGAESRLVLGFPVRAAAVLYVVGLLPLFVLPVVYAVTFDRLTLSDEDIARVRAARRPEKSA